MGVGTTTGMPGRAARAGRGREAFPSSEGRETSANTRDRRMASRVPTESLDRDFPGFSAASSARLRPLSRATLAAVSPLRITWIQPSTGREELLLWDCFGAAVRPRLTDARTRVRMA